MKGEGKFRIDIFNEHKSLYWISTHSSVISKFDWFKYSYMAVNKKKHIYSDILILMLTLTTSEPLKNYSITFMMLTLLLSYAWWNRRWMIMLRAICQNPVCFYNGIIILKWIIFRPRKKIHVILLTFYFST